ncbi:MAG: nucleotidyltransferase family protein [Litoreibacter sp.]|nr:nucleotidyltransferase family protein [Litoreibacter sp.]
MSEPKRDIMIFAAGFGTRMAPLTDAMPKPLIKVAGVTLIDHAVAMARGHTREIHVNAHYRAEQLADHLPGDVVIHIEHPAILDTGGGLKAALPQMRGTSVFALNSDAVFTGPNPLQVLNDAWQDHMEALLLLIPLARTVGYTRPGSFVQDQDGALVVDDAGLAYTGAQIIRREVVEQTEGDVFSLWKIWEVLLARKTAFGVGYPGQWADVGTPEGITLAEEMLRNV